MNEIYIYALKDPINNEIKYIGKTNNIKRRYNNHLQEVNKGINTKKVNWIRKLKENNTKPILEVLEICSDINWQEKEMYWIDIINPKCNQTTGGGGQITNNSDYIKKISTKVLPENTALAAANLPSPVTVIVTAALVGSYPDPLLVTLITSMLPEPGKVSTGFGMLEPIGTGIHSSSINLILLPDVIVYIYFHL
jgi:hypothetical protein